MTNRIFNIENGRVTVNEDVLLIPWLRAVHDKYKDNIAALSYCKYMAEPKGIYSEFDEDTKKEKVLQDFPGDYKPTDKEICVCIEKLKESYETTTIRFFKANKAAVDKLTAYLFSIEIDDSKETGNINYVMKLVEKCQDTIKRFKGAEKEIEDELNTQGGHDLPYDQI